MSQRPKGKESWPKAKIGTFSGQFCHIGPILVGYKTRHPRLDPECRTTVELSPIVVLFQIWSQISEILQISELVLNFCLQIWWKIYLNQILISQFVSSKVMLMASLTVSYFHFFLSWSMNWKLKEHTQTSAVMLNSKKRPIPSLPPKVVSWARSNGSKSQKCWLQ